MNWFRFKLKLWSIKHDFINFYHSEILGWWYHYPKCQNCGHSLFKHVTYETIADREGVCVSFDTPDWDSCGCEDWK